jgi:WD40 repeat protein
MWLWDGDSGRLLLERPRESGSGGVMAVTADQRHVLLSAGHSVAVYDLGDGRQVNELVAGAAGSAQGGPVAGLASDGRRVVALCGDGRLRVWALNSGELLHTLSGDAFGIRELLGVTDDGRRALSQSRSGAVEVWELDHGRRVHTLPHRLQILDWAVGAGDDRLITAARDGRLVEWNLGTGRAVAAFKADGPMRACAQTPSGRIIAGDAFGQVHVLESIPAES